MPVIVATASLIAAAVTLALVLPGEPELLDSAGPAVQYGLPLTKAMVNVAAAGTIGALMLATFVIPPSSSNYRRALDIAAGAAAAWGPLAAAGTVLSFLSVAGTFSADLFVPALAQYVTQVDLGRAWLMTTILAMAVCIGAFAAGSPGLVAVVTATSIVSLVPLALQGHAAGAGGHVAASSALWLHTAGAAVWLGGLAVLVALYARSRDERGTAAVVARYSTIALVSFIVVAISGTIGALLRLDGLDQLVTTPYGAIVTAKILLLALLGVVGAWHRSRLVPRIATAAHSRRAFWGLAIGELALMGLASGLAATLARTSPPVEAPLASTPSLQLTGQPLPPPLTFETLVTQWAWDPIWLLVAIIGTGAYVYGVGRLRRRGDRWPAARTVWWLVGMALLVFITNGGPGAYGPYLFSVHMTAHMALGMLIPIFLTLAAPLTLALRAVRPRDDGSRGLREWLLVVVHSWAGRIITHPVVAALLFASSLIVFYYTPLFGWALEDPIGHQWMVAHFLVVGFLFTQSLAGIDPLPMRLGHPLRLLILFITMGFHAFYGLGIMNASSLLLPDWYGVLGEEWGIDPLADQVLAGALGWSLGEVPTFLLALLVAVRWAKADEKESRRKDRDADRTDGAELAGYNARLAAMADRDRR